MTEPSLDRYRKLQIAPPARVLLLGAPAAVAALLAPPANGIDLVAVEVAVGPGSALPDNPFDAVVCPVRTADEVAARAPWAIAALRPGGLLWFAYPKRGNGIATDINRDRGWQPVLDAGWSGVRQVALDDVWSALRFRPETDIRRKPDSVFAARAAGR